MREEDKEERAKFQKNHGLSDKEMDEIDWELFAEWDAYGENYAAAQKEKLAHGTTAQGTGNP